MSVTSTPGDNEFKPIDLPNGLQTPQSLSDGATDEIDVVEEVKPRRNTKRKSQSHNHAATSHCLS